MVLEPFLEGQQMLLRKAGSVYRHIRLTGYHAYSLPTARTNYGIFNIRFTGAKVWNSIEVEFKNLSFKAFKARLKNSFVSKY